MMCQNDSNSTIINKSPMDFESRCQKVIPTYLRVRMGRRSSFTSRTWSNSTTPDPTSTKMSLENSWKSHCPIATRMNCDWSLKGQHRSESHMEQSTMDHNRMDASTSINHCHHSTDIKMKHTIQKSTQNSHSHKTMTDAMKMMNTGQKTQSHIKHKFSDLHRTHKRTHSTKAYSDCLLVLVCLFTVVIQQVLARPVSSQDYHLNMSLEPNVQSLEDALRSPCREANLPREDQSSTSIKGVLQIIGRQSAIAKSIAKEDIEKYISSFSMGSEPNSRFNRNDKLKITEDSSVEDFHYRWRIMEQAWLYPQGKSIPKEFNEPIPSEIRNHYVDAGQNFHVPTITELLQDSDERFQLLLIGFHNVLDDHNNKRSTMDLEKFGPLYEVFSRAKDNAQKVLCEIRTALHKLGAPINILNPSDIESSKMLNANPIFYDWVIYREYINQLEHINEIVNVIFDNMLE